MNAPFGRTGGKTKSYKKLISVFPEHQVYVEPFGGSGVVLLNKPRVGNEVFNDIEKGLIAFYRCLQDDDLLDELTEKLEYTMHSREFWELCKDSVEPEDVVERAFRWIYIIRFSFGQQGRAFGRTLGKQNGDAKKIMASIKSFSQVHQRLKGVTIECLGFRKILREYDNTNVLFYCDPPYQGTFENIYASKFSMEDHKDLMRFAETCKARIAVSGYANDLYDSYDFWTERITWEQGQPIRGSYRGEGTHDKVEEVLWIK